MNESQQVIQVVSFAMKLFRVGATRLALQALGHPRVAKFVAEAYPEWAVSQRDRGRFVPSLVFHSSFNILFWPGLAWAPSGLEAAELKSIRKLLDGTEEELSSFYFAIWAEEEWAEVVATEGQDPREVLDLIVALAYADGQFGATELSFGIEGAGFELYVLRPPWYEE